MLDEDGIGPGLEMAMARGGSVGGERFKSEGSDGMEEIGVMLGTGDGGERHGLRHRLVR